MSVCLVAGVLVQMVNANLRQNPALKDSILLLPLTEVCRGSLVRPVAAGAWEVIRQVLDPPPALAAKHQAHWLVNPNNCPVVDGIPAPPAIPADGAAVLVIAGPNPILQYHWAIGQWCHWAIGQWCHWAIGQW
jgi:hypothetical protein